jgi:hypothetical protein
VSEVPVYCPNCAAYHQATVSIDDHGWPHTSWSERHDPDAVELQRHREAITDLASAGFAAAVAREHWDWAARFADAALDPNDAEEP